MRLSNNNSLFCFEELIRVHLDLYKGSTRHDMKYVFHQRQHAYWVDYNIYVLPYNHLEMSLDWVSIQPMFLQFVHRHLFG